MLPWDNKFDVNRNKPRVSSVTINRMCSKIIDSICSSAFLQVGQLRHKIDDSIQEERLLRSINMEYQMEGSDWSAHY